MRACSSGANQGRRAIGVRGKEQILFPDLSDWALRLTCLMGDTWSFFKVDERLTRALFWNCMPNHMSSNRGKRAVKNAETKRHRLQLNPNRDSTARTKKCVEDAMGVELGRIGIPGGIDIVVKPSTLQSRQSLYNQLFRIG